MRYIKPLQPSTTKNQAITWAVSVGCRDQAAAKYILVEHEAIVESAVVAKPDETCGEIIMAYIVLVPGFNDYHERIGRWAPGKSCLLRTSQARRTIRIYLTCDRTFPVRISARACSALVVTFSRSSSEFSISFCCVFKNLWRSPSFSNISTSCASSP
ncbi:MAG: hypothetical protein GY820_03565 [Gammaproteobacteria bacterium]|nr:hypothetical protein [Gammaproteobacteria bacterium]